MWKVPEESLKISLPEGFHLEENEDFLYLFNRDIVVAVFAATGVDPEEIKKEAKKYLKKNI